MSKYKRYSSEQLEEHLSNYLLSSWSYSKVSSFARNEKAFEMEEIYGEKGKRSAASIAGNAYHRALERYFHHFGDLDRPGMVDLEQAAFTYIEEVGADEWKLQKTTPTVEACKEKAVSAAVALLGNFMREGGLVTSEIEEVLGVELRCEEWLTVNGVDVPLPCHAYIDLVARTRGGKVVIIDHKSRSAFTPAEEMALTRGKQAITYTLCYESMAGERVDEVWFAENKISANRDKSPQITMYKIEMDKDNRALYEAMLYEPLRRMLQAVSDPDYVYVCNDSDSLCDKAEIYRFWARTMIAEAGDFPGVPEGKRGLIRQRLRKIKDSSLASISPKAIVSFKENAAAFIPYDIANSNMTKEERIEHVLRTFGKICRVAHTISGYSSDTYLLEVSAGVKIGDIARYRMDLANALNLPSVRVPSQLSLYNGEAYLAVEAGKKSENTLLWDGGRLEGLKIPVGVDNYGGTVVWDLSNHSTPHALVCGATGSGKSVCIKSTIEYAKRAGVDRIVIFDPKYEFCGTAGAEVHNDIEDIEERMKGLVEEMQGRAKKRGKNPLTLVVFDEFADAVGSARSGKELDIKEPDPATGKPTVIGREKSLEENLKMLAQKGRSLGFRIMAATQRASAKIITGDTKVNFPVQICFRMPKAVDSKVVIDEEGAESLQGRGDGLMKSPEYLGVVRFQGFYYDK